MERVFLASMPSWMSKSFHPSVENVPTESDMEASSPVEELPISRHSVPWEATLEFSYSSETRMLNVVPSNVAPVSVGRTVSTKNCVPVLTGLPA
ncbi:MAG: hypothetical protein BWY66_01178 [bacterium ADurb.Bin374]|nr:MAG: hypothetical protein BWY66_01178 [bacterium ADurb.Bin374]